MGEVAIVDLGASNTASMRFALERLGVRARLVSTPEQVAEAERLILPGVGHAAFVMGRIEALGLAEAIPAFPRPLLGVCLGLQLLYEGTAEGDVACLGLFPGRVAALEAAPDRPVPHMGWNRLARRAEHPLLEGVPNGAHVYFVHSYAAPPDGPAIATADYGGPFAAVAARGTVMGTQFHPERSGPVGARILENFLRLAA
jgi:glutamine amidotransferase